MSDYKPIGYKLRSRYSKSEPVFARVGGPEMMLAVDFVSRWGMVAAVPDGEDSAGRQKLRLATVDELVERALNTAVALYAAADARGLLSDPPSDPEE